jgi:hypothetical protein
MIPTAFIGLDDTDIQGSPGTGRIAREMAQHLSDMGLGRSLGTTRHQLLVDPRIPYTSHNSSLCIAFETAGPLASLQQPCVTYLRGHFQEGSDPGLCICEAGQVGPDLLRFGQLATTTVLAKQDAIDIAEKTGIFARELGGTGGGIIGAMAAVGLRASGESGRYIGLRGIRDVPGEIAAGRLKEVTDIVSVVDERGQPLDDIEIVDGAGWIRPSLLGGQPVLRVRRAWASDGARRWICLERKGSHQGKQREDQ